MDRWLLLAGAGACALVLHSIHRKRQLRLRASARLAVPGTRKLELLPNERGMIIIGSPPNSTITFFRGSRAAAERYLAERVAAIVVANPWLASVLEWDENGLLAAYYPDVSTAATKCKFEVRADIALSKDGTGYAQLSRVLAPVLCKTSEQSVGTGEPLFKVSLVPDAQEPGDRFAVVVSGNHSLLDGHDYYRLYNMLSNDGKVEALNPERKQDMPAKILAAMGGEPSLMAICPPGFLARFISGQLRNALFPATHALGFYVSEAWIKEQKSVEQNQMAQGQRTGSTAFVSTNDILVSAFSNLTHSDVSMMAINWRGKISDCTEQDVGNYVDLMCYTPADYASPALIRKSISPEEGPYTGAAHPRARLPSNWEHLTGGTYAAMTNWASFAKPLALSGVEQDLHIPLFEWNKACPACVVSSMVIFQPCAGRVGVMVAGKRDLVEAVRRSGMVGCLLPANLAHQA